MMNKEYPSTYANFRYRANMMINNAEMLGQRLHEQGSGEVAHEVKKPETKSEKPYKKLGSAYRAMGSFKPFDDELEVKLI